MRFLEMTTEQFIAHSRGGFAILRWAPFVAIFVLPFTLEQGLISLRLFLGAVVVAAILLVSQLLAWRTRQQLWFGGSFIALVFGSRVVGIGSPEVSTAQAIQWICFVLVLAGAPLLLFRGRLLRLARLDDSSEVAEVD